MLKKTLKIIGFIIMIILVPTVAVAGYRLFGSKAYAWLSLAAAVLACVPFFLVFEKGKSGTREMLIIAVMTALSVAGRLIFTPIPSFKPVTALVVITAMYFGSEAGFMTGALTALISNFYFGQGPWTPFQMFAWGFLGLLSGLLAKYLKKYFPLLLVWGAAAGLFFSLLMDVWTVIWWDGTFNFTRYIAAITTAAPITLIYAVSNVVFLLILAKPIGKVLERIKTKYGIGAQTDIS